MLANLFAQANAEDIEARLSGAKGKERIAILAKLVDTYRYENSEKALKYGKEALELLKTFTDKKIQVSLLNNMCNSALYQGDDKTAKEYAEKGLSIAQDIDDQQGIAGTMKLLARASVRGGQFAKVLDYCTRSAKIYKDLNDKGELADTYNLIGSIYWELGDYASALNYLFDSLHIYEELNNQKGIAKLYNNIGIQYWELGKIDKSLEYYLKALKIQEKLDNKQSIALALTNISKVYRHQRQYEASLEYCNKALDIAKELDDKSLISHIHNNIGEIYVDMNDDQRAIEQFNRSLEIRRGLNDRKWTARTLINLASANRRLGNYQKSVRQVMEALDIAQQIDIKAEIQDAYLELSETYEIMNKHPEALGYYKKYKEMYDSIFNDESSKKIAGLQATLDIEKGEREIAILKIDREMQRRLTFFLVLFACLILVLAFVIFARYRLKARVNRELEKEIEERKRTEEKLRESEEKFRVLAEKSVVGIWIIQDQVVKYANPRHSKIFGYSLEEIIGKDPLELAVEEDRPLVNQNLEKRLKGTNGILPYEFKGRTKAGEILHLESYGSLTHFKGQPAVLETIIDISDRKKVEMELLKSRKLESVGILAGGIAHDFNNLLTVIIGNISMTKMTLERHNVDADKYASLDDAEKASYQATDLAQKFITFSEGGWITPRKITLRSLLKNTIHLYSDLEELHYNISIPGDLKPLYGDERQLREVIINVLLNASEAISSQNKEVTIAAENVDLPPENNFLLKEGEYVKISFIDKGIGIPVDRMEKIFDPYFSTKNQVNRKGLGLGLAICYSIIKKHDGHISIQSEVGKGTTVDLYLPAYTGMKEQPLVI